MLCRHPGQTPTCTEGARLPPLHPGQVHRPSGPVAPSPTKQPAVPSSQSQVPLSPLLCLSSHCPLKSHRIWLPKTLNPHSTVRSLSGGRQTSLQCLVTTSTLVSPGDLTGSASAPLLSPPTLLGFLKERRETPSSTPLPLPSGQSCSWQRGYPSNPRAPTHKRGGGQATIRVCISPPSIPC